MIMNVPGAGRPCGRAGHAVGGSRRMRGISLIEVLVSVVILGIGLLGIAAMQSVALRSGQSSLESSQAVMQTMAITEAMRANRINAAAYNGNWTTPPAATTLATRDLNEWIAGMRGTAAWQTTPTPNLPPVLGATAEATIAGCPDDCVITIRWDDSRAGGGAARQVVTRTRI